jgi:deoxycytidylate deaminase
MPQIGRVIMPAPELIETWWVIQDHPEFGSITYHCHGQDKAKAEQDAILAAERLPAAKHGTFSVERRPCEYCSGLDDQFDQWED